MGAPDQRGLLDAAPPSGRADDIHWNQGDRGGGHSSRFMVFAVSCAHSEPSANAIADQAVDRRRATSRHHRAGHQRLHDDPRVLID